MDIKLMPRQRDAIRASTYAGVILFALAVLTIFTLYPSLPSWFENRGVLANRTNATDAGHEALANRTNATFGNGTTNLTLDATPAVPANTNYPPGLILEDEPASSPAVDNLSVIPEAQNESVNTTFSPPVNDSRIVINLFYSYYCPYSNDARRYAREVAARHPDTVRLNDMEIALNYSNNALFFALMRQQNIPEKLWLTPGLFIGATHYYSNKTVRVYLEDNLRACEQNASACPDVLANFSG